MNEKTVREVPRAVFFYPPVQRVHKAHISLTFRVVCSKMYETNWGRMPSSAILIEL
jgi:hypothetical protein